MSASNEQFEKTENSPLLEEGMYYERVFGPEKVRVLFDERTKDLAKIIFEDKNGQTLEIARAQLRLVGKTA